MSPPFRLASLLKLRQQQRDHAGKEVSDAQLAIVKLDEKLAEIDQQNRAMDALRKESSSGNIDLGQILEAQRYQLVLAAQSAHIMNDRALLVQEVDRRKVKLLKCQQALKALENLRERHLRQAEESASKREQHALDEWSQTHSVTQTRSFL